jgi:parallel beta-helix repeat protein
MKRKLWLLALLGAVLCATSVMADDGFFVIAGGGKAGTQINSVPYTITSPGLYCLAQNLSYSATTGYAIAVAASDVTLDLMGFCLTGPGKASGANHGININNAIDNVEIRNGTVKAFGGHGILNGINPNDVGVRVIGLRASGNGGAGIALQGYNHLVMGCSLLNNGDHGALIGQGMLKGNHAYNNGKRGVSIISGEGSTVSGNVCRDNVQMGIYAAAGSTVVDNTVRGNGEEGIGTGEGCTVMRNTSRGNTKGGIVTGPNCLISNNTTQGLTSGPGSISVSNVVY